jgi:hypothetical protein
LPQQIPNTTTTIDNVTEHEMDTTDVIADTVDEQHNDETETSASLQKIVNEQMVESDSNKNVMESQDEEKEFDNEKNGELSEGLTETTTTMFSIDTDAVVTESINTANDDDENEMTTSSTLAVESNDDDNDDDRENSDVQSTSSPQIASNEEEEKDDDEKNSDENGNKIPDSLLNAVGDLLSSVLGISVSQIDNGLFIPTSIMQANAQPEVPAVDDSSENENSKLNEVDLKIENLASVEQTSFMTESAPEVYAETVKEQPTTAITNANDDETSHNHRDENNNDDDDSDGVLEALSEITTDVEEAIKPVSIEESVNHVMNLVKGTEGRIALEAAQNIVDSILIDKNMKEGDEDDIVYGTLKELQTNLGMNEDEEGDDSRKDSFYTKSAFVDQDREEMIKNFEADIHESLANGNSYEYENLNFMPNPAKAAMYYKFQYGEDF